MVSYQSGPGISVNHVTNNFSIKNLKSDHNFTLDSYTFVNVIAS